MCLWGLWCKLSCKKQHRSLWRFNNVSSFREFCDVWNFNANVSFMHLYSSYTDYENFYPKGKKEIPKGNEQKSESKGECLHFSYLYIHCWFLYSLLAWKFWNIQEDAEISFNSDYVFQVAVWTTLIWFLNIFCVVFNLCFRKFVVKMAVHVCYQI